MKVIGFNYTKVNAERSLKEAKVEKINQDLEFINVEKDELGLAKDLNIIKISFTFKINYDPNCASISLDGTAILNTSPEESKQILKAWKKKQIEDSVRMPLIKLIMNKCSLKALNLEEELNIPPHMRLVNVSAS